jgi:hypothetical protein
MPNIPSHPTDPSVAVNAGKDSKWARRCFWRAFAGNLLPFVSMLAIIATRQFFAVDDAAQDVESLIDRFEQRIAAATAAKQPFNPELAAQAIVDEVYNTNDKAASPDEYKKFTRIVRTVAYQVQSREVRRVAEGGAANRRKGAIFSELLFHACGVWVIQVTVVLFFPGMLICLIFLAKYVVERNPTPRPNQFATFLEEAQYRRSLWLLEEESHLRLWRRLGFALVLTLGSMYLFAPTGLKSTAVAEYAAMKAIPSESSYPTWLDAFKNAPPAMAGFAGFFLFALTMTAQRFAAGDLSDRFFVSLFNRSISVMLLSLVLSGVTTQGEPISRALAFMVGVFPQSGLQAISKLAGTTMDRFTLDDSTPRFRDLPEIDYWKESVLGELGILSLHDLSNENLKELISRVGFNPGVLVNAVDRALLLDALGPAAAKLTSIPIASASQFVLYLRGRDAIVGDWASTLPDLAKQKVTLLDDSQKHVRMELVKSALGLSDPSVVLDQLASNSNVLFIIEKRICYDDI